MAKAPTLYRKQRQIIDFIHQYIQKYGHAPTLVEIAKSINVKSLATVHEHMKVLEKKGVIRKWDGVIRGIEILDKHYSQEFGGAIDLPLLGFIAAGKPLEPHTDPDATLKVAPVLLSGKKRAFVLQIKGESMIEDGIFDGDYVVVEQQEEASNGDIVVALLEGGLATLKRFFKETDRIRLEPANAKMQPIFARHVQIQGRVVGLIRKY